MALFLMRQEQFYRNQTILQQNNFLAVRKRKLHALQAAGEAIARIGGKDFHRNVHIVRLTTEARRIQRKTIFQNSVSFVPLW